MADDTHSRFATVSHLQFKILISCSWPYDKTYDTHSFVGQGNMTTLGWKCHTRPAPLCDILASGSSYFHVPLTTVRHLLNVFKWVIWVMKAKCVFTGKDLGLKWWVRYTDKIWSLKLKTICRRVDDSVASCRFATWVHGYGNRIISERTSVVRSCSWWPFWSWTLRVIC